MVGLEKIECLVEVEEAVLFPLDGIALEELNPLVEASFLSVVDQRDAVHDKAENGKDLGSATQALPPGSRMFSR